MVLSIFGGRGAGYNPIKLHILDLDGPPTIPTPPPAPFTLTFKEMRMERARLLRRCRDIWPKGTNREVSLYPLGRKFTQ